jgi:hypothetical protein
MGFVWANIVEVSLGAWNNSWNWNSEAKNNELLGGRIAYSQVWISEINNDVLELEKMFVQFNAFRDECDSKWMLEKSLLVAETSSDYNYGKWKILR